MRPPVIVVPAARRIASTLLVAALAGACAGTAASVPPTSGPPADPTPVIPLPTPPEDGAGYWLRVTTSQAIPPVDRFAVPPVVVVTVDGRLLVPGAVPAIYPGPLVTPLFARQVSEAGRARVLAWADELGLLGGDGDVRDGPGVPGGIIGRIELTVDGRRVTLLGTPDAPRTDEPGTPGAFAELWSRLGMLPETLAGELGPELPYTPTAYAILVGPPPAQEPGLPGLLADWPLEVAVGQFGAPVQDGTYRCGLVDGGDAAAMGAAVGAASQLTQWVQDPEMSATFGLTARPIVAGEDPCADVFGG